ncbi:MAG: TonB-dependent receptor [Alphaproteobacteria bacterium]|nr:TonB-dependent receptor [Alphaproteobacteria bacterium]HPF47441.1 TonB-dependent receptor [Emcibacteraceae bacterium]HRW28665.1 TonB-dependent receptor [Emcibacteraceae bacterium]
MKLKSIRMNNFRRSLIAGVSVIAISLGSSGYAQKSNSVTNFNIEAGSLKEALNEYINQSGVQLIYRDEQLEGIWTDGIYGSSTREDALHQLLSGSNLTIREDSSGAILVMANSPIHKAGFQKISYAEDYQENLAVPQADETADRADAMPVEVIVAVGSQIKGARVTGTLPVTSMKSEDIQAIGAASGDELFRTLPSAGSMTFGGNSSNSQYYGVNSARGDVASINLRTLGAGNTLVLMNGRRLVDHPGAQPNEQNVPEVTVNMNAIPVMGLDRVEVLRDGASAIYGTDAVAGVINTVLRSDYEGLEVTSRYGKSFGTGMDELTLNSIAGFRVNNDKTHIVFSVNRFERDPMYAREREYSAQTDRRPLVVGTPFEGDLDFRNDSTATPWGVYVAMTHDGVGIPITQNGTQITSNTGRFSIQPTSLGNCTASLVGADGYCLTDKAVTDPSLRYNSAYDRQLIPASKRINLYSMITTEFENGWEMYTELGYYTAKSTYDYGKGNVGPLSHSPLWIPASNYWNPFGQITLDNGQPNPNRLPGLDINQVPAEGLDIPLGSRFGTRLLTMERKRITTVIDESFRVVQGLKGEIGDWDFDTGFVYSESETDDSSAGRISATEFIQTLGLNTPLAYNPFNGAGAYTDNAVDETPNPEATVNRYTITVDRYSKTSLLLADLKLSNAALFELPAGDVGFAIGAEFRRHTYLDDRDDRMTGVIPYDLPNPFGAILDSDVVGSSPNSDSYGDRNVFSVSSEVILPLVSEDMDIPFVKEFNVQIAGRFEDFSDVGSVIKPRVAASWYPVDGFQFRGSWALGFKAPNLAQTSAGKQVIVIPRQDYYFCDAAVQKGLTDSLANCNNATLDAIQGYLYNNTSTDRVTYGSDQLKPENTSSISFGAVWQPEFIEGLTLTADYWRIKQSGIVGIVSVVDNLKLDYAMRKLGLGPNPNIIRSAPTPEVNAFFAGSGVTPIGEAYQSLNPYMNLDDRVVSGIDMQAIYVLNDTSIGDFRFSVSASRLLKAEQSLGSLYDPILALNDPNITVVGGGNLLEQNDRPKLRGNASVSWFKDNWTTSIFANYIGAVNDLSASIPGPDGEPIYWRVDSWTTVNMTVGYDFTEGSLEGFSIKAGLNNILGTSPPLADEDFGFMSALHSPRGRYGYLDLKYAF